MPRTLKVCRPSVSPGCGENVGAADLSVSEEAGALARTGASGGLGCSISSAALPSVATLCAIRSGLVPTRRPMPLSFSLT